MKKHKKLIIILVIVAVAAVLFVIFGVPYIQRHFIETKVDEQAATAMDKVDLGTDRILTVYFTRNGNCDFKEGVDAVSSASLMRDGDKLIGNCELAAEMVQNAVGGDIYAIRTVKKYPSSYSGTVNEASDELKNDELPELSGDLPDMTKYDTVIILYPLWWGTVPKAVESFVKSADISDKTVYAIVSHGGSGKADSIADLEKASGATVSGEVFELYDKDAATSKDDIQKWLEGLK
ncbi:MAG: flavodoxin [Ruminococcus sp.]|nr:flavodoxin [Ruminococcus sp.]